MPGDTTSAPPRRHVEPILLGLLIVAVAVNQLHWLVTDTRLMAQSTDAYSFLRLLLQFIDGLAAGEPGGIHAALNELSLAGRPPLYQLLAVPFVLVFGRSADAALGLNLVLQALLMLIVYRSAALIASRRAGLLAALLVAAYPPLIQLSRIFRPHYATAVCAAFSLLCLMWLVQRPSRPRAWLWGLSLAAGMLIHPYFALVAAGPALVFAVYFVFFREAPRRPEHAGRLLAWIGRKLADPLVLGGLVPGGLIFVALSASWYLGAGSRLWGMGAQFAQGEVITMDFKHLDADRWWYLRTAPGAISNVLAVAALLGTVHGLLRRQVLPVLASLALLSGYFALGSLWVMTWWYFASALPFAAVVTATWVTASQRRWLTLTLTSVTVAAAVFVFGVVNFGLADAWRPIAKALVSPEELPVSRLRATCVLGPDPPRDDPWPAAEVIQRVLDDTTATPERPARLFVTRGETRGEGFFFEYVLVRDWPEERRLQILHQRTSPDNRDVEPKVFVAFADCEYVLQCELPTPLKLMLVGKKYSIRDAFEVLGEFEVPSVGQVALLRRRGPLTVRQLFTLVAAFEEWHGLPGSVRRAGQAIAAGRLEAGYEVLEEAAKAAGATGKSYRALVGLLLAEQMMRTERYADAARHYRQVLELHPDHSGARDGLERSERAAAAARPDR